VQQITSILSAISFHALLTAYKIKSAHIYTSSVLLRKYTSVWHPCLPLFWPGPSLSASLR